MQEKNKLKVFIIHYMNKCYKDVLCLCICMLNKKKLLVLLVHSTPMNKLELWMI